MSSDSKRHEADEYFDRRAFMAFRYRVPPSLHNDFIDAWRKMEAEVAKEGHVTMYDLVKTMQDNIEFVTYGEWDTMVDFLDHYHMRHTREFMDFMAANDLTWEMYPLKNVTSIKHEARALRSSEEDDPIRRRRTARIMFHFHMQPSAKDDFIDAWEDMAKDTWDEKRNMVYSLRKVTTNNHHFMGWGVWESTDDFMDHLDSKHVNKFRKFAAKNDVVWYFDPCWALGKEFGM